MIKNNKEKRKILKIKCNIPEWEAFDKMNISTLLEFEQIVGEFYWYF